MSIVRIVLYSLAAVLSFSGSMAQQANKPVSAGVPSPTINVPTPEQYTTTPAVNFVRTWDAQGKYTSPDALMAAGYLHRQEATLYIDGLGRPLQTVTKQSSVLANDIVSPIKYDAFSREVVKYLPYVQTSGAGNNNGAFKTNPFVDQSTFYQSSTYNPALTGEQVFFSSNVFEASPLNRVTKTMAPGNSWTGSDKGVTNDYLVNTDGDAVRIWTIDPSTGLAVSPDTYDAGQLYKTVTRDENNNITIEFKDKDDRVVLKKMQVDATVSLPADYGSYTKFLCTYYVYDDLDQLRFVLPPNAVKSLSDPLNNWVMDATLAKDVCFRYEYDGRKRMIAKKIPGAGWIYMVYDKRDRLVFTQDANLRKTNQWLATMYDGLNRPVMTGMSTYTGNREQLQALVNAQTGSGGSGGVPVGGTFDANPVFNLRNLQIPVYKARESISFLPGFGSETGDDFVAEIDPNLTGVSDNIDVTDNPLPSGVSFIPLTITYYDAYGDWKGNKTYSTADNTKLDVGTNLHAEAPPATASATTKGLVTGTRVRILENLADLEAGAWLTSVAYYDEEDRVIQTQSDNYKQGVDVATRRYDFSGKVLTAYLKHENPNSSTATTRVKTNMEYDFGDRLLTIKKTINDLTASTVTIAKNEYDELGQLNKKELGQQKGTSGYTTTPIETLNYEFNIRGWLQGVNKAYARGSNNDHWFGMELDYDYGFGINQLNGNIAGAKWRSKGDGQQRAFGYTYDPVSRILGADFSEGSGTNYTDNPLVNFDMVMGNGLDGTAAYDANGNIRKMKQMGMKGLKSSTTLDDLTYSYYGNGNKLKSVTDGITADNKLGDFTDKNGGDDYGYDENGNMINDLNKKIGSNTGEDLPGSGAIKYNHLNLPYQITMKDDVGLNDKGTITYIYDAAGTKWEKRVHENASSSNNNTTKDLVTYYAAGFQYEDKTVAPAIPANADYQGKLQFFGHEEGRVRVELNENGDPLFHYDYFVKDHLGNVRMVLTEEKQETPYLASMETAKRIDEEKVFRNISNTAFPSANVPGGYPADATTNPNDFVAKLNGSGNKIGPNLVLKVMSGDKLNISAKSFYRPHGSPDQPANILSDVLSTLASGIVGNIGEMKGTVAALSNPSSSPLASAMTGFVNSNTTPSDKPKAYLNYVFLDEQFNVQSNSGSLPAGLPDVLNTPAITNLVAPKNGFVYIYVSNETPNWDVFFDNLLVNHIKSPLLEETHYYPFGLTMAGVSSSAAGNLQNRFMFNAGTELENNEFTDRSGLEWYATDFRSYDPQVGRFIQQDALAEIYEHLTSYSFANNNPILLNDPFGLSSDTIPHLPIVWVIAPQTPALPPATPLPIQPAPSDNSQARNVPTVPVGPVKLPEPTLPKPPPAKPSGGTGGSIANKALGTIGLLLTPISTGDGLDRAVFSSSATKLVYEGHANKLYNWNTHIVYSFFFTPKDGRTPVIKYGISDETRYSLERPERQKPYYMSRFGASADYRILTRTLTRAGALAIERNLVELHLKIWGTMPRDQIRPTIN